MKSDVLAVPERRVARLREILALLSAADSIVLTTHVNADGDGTGSETAVAMWLSSLGKTVRIVNPTPYPEQYMHLVADPEWIRDPSDARAIGDVASADLVLVLDTAEPKRI